MPECHRCKYDGCCDPHCLRCKGPPATNHKGQTFVSIDAGSGKLTRQRSGSANGQTFGEVLASSEAEDDHEPDALDQDQGDTETAADDPDQGGEQAALEAGRMVDARDQVAGLATTGAEHGTAHDPDSPLDMARKLAFTFTELETAEFDLVRALMRGESMADIGRRSGVTRAAVSTHVRTLVRKHPVFLFLRKAAGAPFSRG